MERNNKVFVKRTFACSAQRLFEWLTQPEQLMQWFGPEGFHAKKVISEPVKGGTYQIEMWKKELYAFTVLGTYLEVDPPRYLKLSYDYRDLKGRPSSEITFSLEEQPTGDTTLHFVQEFEETPPDYSTRTIAWNYMFKKLNSLVV